jgi:hypothetical protein
MTARELARAVRNDATDDREKDAWISGILAGRQGLHVKYLDAVSDKLALSPSELVRHDDSTLRELTPREMRLLKHYQDWSNEQQDRWLEMLDYFTAEVPDKDTARILDRLRTLPPSWRRPVLGWLYQLLEGNVPPEALTPSVLGAPIEVPRAPTTLRLHPRKKQLSANVRKDTPK